MSVAGREQVFDDWKADVEKAGLLKGGGVEPRLSTVSLAFLEACCRADPAFEWRVYDVCAAMRQQEERVRVVRHIFPINFEKMYKIAPLPPPPRGFPSASCPFLPPVALSMPLCSSPLLPPCM